MGDTGNKPRERTIHEKLRCLEEKLFRVENDLSALNNRMSGRSQEAEKDGSPKLEMSGSVGEAHNLADRLNRTSDRIESEVFNLKSVANTIQEESEIPESSGCCKAPSC